MLSRIEQFRQSFKTRKTEENDTRQDIQRHDPDFHKKKRQDDEGGFKDPYEDLTDVSVTALITFLEGLLDRPDGHQTATATTETAQPSRSEYRPPADPARAKAMNAYQARNPQPPVPPSSTDPDSRPQTALDKAAATLDQAAIRATIRDLHGLLGRGIDHIALERGDGFLESIQNAVAKY